MSKEELYKEMAEYNKEAVLKDKRIKKAEASAIHRLLKGRAR
jgi:hypothetical protein